MFQPHKHRIAFGAVLAAGITGLSAAGAAAFAPHPAGPGPAAPQLVQGAVAEQELRSYARASIGLREVQEEWGPRIRSAGTAAEQDALRQQANEAMVEAVQDEGLTVQQFNDIYQATQADERLRERVAELLAELR